MTSRKPPSQSLESWATAQAERGTSSHLGEDGAVAGDWRLAILVIQTDAIQSSILFLFSMFDLFFQSSLVSPAHCLGLSGPLSPATTTVRVGPPAITVMEEPAMTVLEGSAITVLGLSWVSPCSGGGGGLSPPAQTRSCRHPRPWGYICGTCRVERKYYTWHVLSSTAALHVVEEKLV